MVEKRQRVENKIITIRPFAVGGADRMAVLKFARLGRRAIRYHGAGAVSVDERRDV